MVGAWTWRAAPACKGRPRWTWRARPRWTWRPVDVAGAAAVEAAAPVSGAAASNGGGRWRGSSARARPRLSEKRRSIELRCGEETDRAAPRVSEAKHFCGAPAGRAPQKLSNIFVAHRGGAAPQKDTFLWRTIVGVRHRYFLAVIAVAVFWQLLLLLFFCCCCFLAVIAGNFLLADNRNCWQLLLAIFLLLLSLQ